MTKPFAFGSNLIGPGQPVYVIAEIGVNHEGNIDQCARMIEAAAKAGANAIKLQTCPPDENYVRGTESHKLFSTCELTRNETAQMFTLAKQSGIDAFTTSPDLKTLEWVDRLDPAGHKISSGMMTNPVIIKKSCATGRPVLMSTGLADEAQIEEAVNWVKECSSLDRFALLQCTSLYPAPPESIHLATIRALEYKHHVPVGFSDHTLGEAAAPLAVAAGACIIEKHFTFDKTRPDFDHRLSLEPQEFARMVTAIRKTEIYVGSNIKTLTPELQDNAKKLLRCLVARKPIQRGEIFTPENVALKRPLPDKRGLEPVFFEHLLGQKAETDLAIDDPIQHEHIVKINARSNF
jgi:sialic acid synthase SpsE